MLFKKIMNEAAKRRDIVFHVDVLCKDCHRMNKEATYIYANDLLEGDFNVYNFEYNFDYYCKHCRGTRRLQIENIKNMVAHSTLYHYFRSHSKNKNSKTLNYQLWENTFTKNRVILNQNSILPTFSQAEYTLFIPLQHADESMQKEFQNLLSQYKEKNKKVEETPSTCIQFFKSKKIDWIIPTTMNLDEERQFGLIFDKRNHSFSLAEHYPRALYSKHQSDFHSKEWYFDPFNSTDDLRKDNYFDVAYDIKVEELGKIEFEGSIKPRKLFKIIDSELPELTGKYLQLRYDAKLQLYVYEEIIDELPQRIHQIIHRYFNMNKCS